MLYPSRKVIDTDCYDRYQERMSPRFGVDDGIRARLEEIQSSPLTSNEMHMQSPDALEYKVRHLEEQLSSLTNKYEQVVVDSLTPSRDAFPFRRSSSLVSGLRNKIQADTTSDTSTAGMSNHDRNPQPDDNSQADIPDTVSVASAMSVEEAEEVQEVEDVVTTIDPKVIRVLIPKSISEPDDLKLQCLKTRKDIEALLKKFVTLKLRLRQAENKHRQNQERLQERIDKLKESNQKLKELVPLVEKQSEHISALHEVLRDTEAELKRSQSDAKRLTNRVTDTERRETALISVVEELRTTIKDAQREISNLHADGKTLKETHHATLEKVQHDMVEMRRTHESTEGKWHSETADLQQQVVLLTQELHHLKEKESEAGETVDALKRANARITSERDEVLDKQKTLLASVEQFDSHLSTLRTELSIRNKSVEDLKAVVVDYEKKAQALLQEVQSLTESNAELTRQVETQARVLEAKESRLVSLRDELSQNKQATVERVLEFEDEKKQHQSMIRDLEQKLEEAKGYIRLVKGSYDRLADNSEDLVSHLEPVRKGIARKRCSRHRLTEVASTPASRSASVSSTRSVSLEPCQDELTRAVQAVESFPGLLESKIKVIPESFQPNLVLKDDEPEQWLEPLSVPVQFTKRTRSKSLVGDTPRFGY